MDHERWKELVFALRDGELGAAEAAEAERHLAACGECAGMLRRWERLAGTLLRAPDAAPSGALPARVLAALESAAAPARWLYWVAPAFGLAFATLVFSTSLPRREPVVSAEQIVLADARSESRWSAGVEEPAPDDLLQFAMEAP